MISLQVKGMSCNHCVMAVTRAVKEVDAGANVAIDLPSGRVDVDSQRDAKAKAIADAIVDAGYEVLSTAA